jgi:hypothetical protein
MLERMAWSSNFRAVSRPDPHLKAGELLRGLLVQHCQLFDFRAGEGACEL